MRTIFNLLIIIIVFVSGAVFASLSNFKVNAEQPLETVFFGIAQERNSPFDWIKKDQIHVYDDRVIIEIKDPVWAEFTDTNSMDPVIDAGSNAIEIVPKNDNDIHIGDIISYKTPYADGTIIHRVIEINSDEDGWYAIVKGDNNPMQDPGKVRFSQIQRIVVAVIY